MSEKPKTNGHDKAEVHTNPGSVRVRKSRDCKKAGIVTLRGVQIGPEMLDALIQFGWLFAEQRHDAGAVSDAVGALTFQALNCGMRPVMAGRAYVPVSHAAVSQAAVWLRPDERELLTPESAGKGLSILADCAELSGFNPQVFTARAVQLTNEINARGIVPAPQEITH